MSQVTKLIPTSGPGSGTVTSISAGTGITLTPDPIVATGSVALTVPVSIANGGTNATSMANTYGVNYYDGTRLVTTAVGTATHVLTSNGVGVAPTFQALPASGISITGDTGGALGPSSSFTFTGGTTGLSFGGSGTTQTLTFAGITANGGTVSLATDATTSTINVGTGAGVKTTTLGSTNTTSSTAIKSGTGNIIANSGFTVDSTGRNYNTVQPAFNAYPATSPTNVTGDGTVYVIPFDTEVFDQGSNFNTGTYTFTAPIAGRYQFNVTVGLSDIGAAHTLGTYRLVTTGATYFIAYNNPFLVAGANGVMILSGSFLVNMAASDTAYVDVAVYNGTKTVDLYSALGTVSFSGFLVC